MSQQYLYDINFIKNMGMKNDQSTITLYGSNPKNI